MVWLHLLAVAADPAAAVDAHHRGKRPVAVGRHRQVQLQVGVAALAENQVRFLTNLRAVRGRQTETREHTG